MVKYTDAGDNTTETHYDVRGRVELVDPPSGPSIGYEYDGLDRLITSNILNGTTIVMANTIEYDYAGRKTGMDDEDMGEWEYSYDALNLTSQEDARGCTTSLSYDSMNRPIERSYTAVSPCESTDDVDFEYDGEIYSTDFPHTTLPISGWTESQSGVSLSSYQVLITGANTWDRYVYRSSTIEDGQAVRFSFKVTDTNLNASYYLENGTAGTSDFRRWGVKVYSGKVQRMYMQGTTGTYEDIFTASANTWYEAILVADGYDSFRVVVWEQDDPATWGENVVTFAEVDDWKDRDWTFGVKTYLSGKTAYLDDYSEFDAGAVGQRSEMTDGSGSTGWVFDARSRVITETKTIDGTGGGTFVTQFSYYTDDQVKDMWYPGGNNSETGEKVTFTYHPQVSLDDVVGSTTYVDGVSYDAASRITELVYGSSTITRSYDYYAWNTNNGWGRLEQITSGSIQDLDYTYDANGNIIQIDDNEAGSPQRQSFEYDAMNRLVDAEVTGGTYGIYSEEYQYDSSTGNLKKKTWGSDLYTYTYDTSHKHAVASATYGSTTWSYDYDDNGNMDSRSDGSTTTTLDYDVENRLVSTSNPSATFVYDGNGARVKGTIGGNTTVYIGNYYEWTGSASTMKSYYYTSAPLSTGAGGTRVAMRDGNGTGTNGLSWLLADHLGSTSLTTNASGTKTAEVRYKAWGEDRYTWGTTLTTMKYTGQREESLLGLYFYNARWYDSKLGRFIQADTIIPEPGNPMAWDRYAYTINNPVNYIDPTGPVVEGMCGGKACKKRQYNDILINTP